MKQWIKLSERKPSHGEEIYFCRMENPKLVSIRGVYDAYLDVFCPYRLGGQVPAYMITHWYSA